jgi:acyl-CoA synthetase (AMP-forming)/AMP-acid ligase II
VGNRLSAYVATREAVTGPELAAFCAARIPTYMIPEAFELSGALPRTSNGKIDRTALAALAGAAAAGDRPPPDP